MPVPTGLIIVVLFFIVVMYITHKVCMERSDNSINKDDIIKNKIIVTKSQPCGDCIDPNKVDAALFNSLNGY